MEPAIESIVLHPAVLIASGFEALSSQQARFLNALRQHFHTKPVDWQKVLCLSPKDFALGGILNPHGQFLDCDQSFHQSAGEVPDFPYLKLTTVLRHFYAPHVKQIWADLLKELYIDLSHYCMAKKTSREALVPTHAIMHSLYPYPAYQKIVALHLCGLGSKLSDAFAYVFHQFKSFERRQVKNV